MARKGRDRTTHKPANEAPTAPAGGRTLFDWLLLGLCLLLLALRATVAESPIARGSAIAGEAGDAVYTLTLSALLIAALLCRIIDTALSGRWTWRRGGFELGAAVFMVGAVVSGLFASDKRSAISGVVMLVAPIAMAAIMLQVLTTRRRIMLTLSVISALAAANAYQGLGQYLLTNEDTIKQYEENPQSMLGPLGIEPGSFQQFMFEHRLYSRGVRGFFTTRNTAGCYIMLALFPASAMLLDRWRKRRKEPKHALAAAIVTAAMALCLLLTRSKGAIIGLLAAALLMLLLIRYAPWIYRRRRRLLIAILLLAALGAVAVAGHGLAHGTLPGGNSMLVRWQYWRAAAQMYADHPMGVGAGNFGTFYTHYKPPEAVESVADPHNFALSLLAQYGPIGLLGFLLMVLGPLWRSLAPDWPDETDPDAGSARANGVFALLLGLALVFLRPILMPVGIGGGAAVVIYIVVAVYIAPAAAFIVGMVSFAGPFRPKAPADGWVDLRLISVSLLCAVVAALIQNLIDFAIFEPGVYTALWALIACIGACEYVSHRRKPADIALPPFAKPAICLAAVVFAAVFLTFAFIPVYKSQTEIAAAVSALKKGREDLADTALAAAVDDDSLSDEALDMRARLYMRKYARSTKVKTPLYRAADCLTAAIERNPANYKTRERLGRVYELLSDTPEAVEAVKGAIAMYPGSGRLHLTLAQLLEKDSPRQALEQYKLAVSIEDAFAGQFRKMYPDHEVVSRMGRADYDFAKRRIEVLSSQSGS